MCNERQNVLQTLARFSIYTLLILGGLSALPHLIKRGDYALFRENGPIELLQFAFIGQAAVVFAVGAWKEPPMRCLFTQFSLIALIAACRELDGYFDRLPIIRWEMPAAVIIVIAIYLARRDWATLMPQVDRFVSSAPFGVLWASFIIIALMAQLIGNGHFLELVMGDDYLREYKRVIEEITELFGYMIFLFGSAETVLFDAKFRRAQSAGIAIFAEIDGSLARP